MPSRSQGHILGGSQHLPGGRGIRGWKATGQLEHRDADHELRTQPGQLHLRESLGNTQRARVYASPGSLPEERRPHELGRGGACRSTDLTGSLPFLPSRPSPFSCSCGPISGHSVRGAQRQSRPPGAGHPDHPQNRPPGAPPSLFRSWRGTSLLQGQGVSRLAGSWWGTGWHPPPTTPPSWQDKVCVQVPRSQGHGGGYCC